MEFEIDQTIQVGDRVEWRGMRGRVISRGIMADFNVRIGTRNISLYSTQLKKVVLW